MAATQADHLLFDEVLDFLASTPTPAQIIAFHPSETLQARLRYLLDGSDRAQKVRPVTLEVGTCCRKGKSQVQNAWLLRRELYTP